MSSSFNEYWEAIRATEGSPFAKTADDAPRLIESKLWHDRPRAEVHRFTVQQQGSQRTYYLKRYKGEDGGEQREYDVLVDLDRCFAQSHNLGVVRPVVYVANISGFVTEEFVGVNLYRLFRRASVRLLGAGHSRNALRVASRLAEWVRIFQGVLPPVEANDDHVETLLSVARTDLRKAQETRMLREDTAKAVDLRLKALASELSGRSAKLVAANQDAKLWNFLLGSDNELRGLDFVGFNRGLPSLDVARLWIGLNWLKVFSHNSPRRIEAIQRSFLDTCYTCDSFDVDELLFHQLCVGTEIAAFYSGIRKDKYRRKLRNIVFFKLIQRYFDRMLTELVEGHPARSWL